MSFAVGRLVPRICFFTKGIGRHKEHLSSFESALRSARIEKQNLVAVSSIFPPGCKFVSREEGLKFLGPGQITYIVMARNETNVPHRLISAAVGMSIPKDGKTYGYLSEHHTEGENEEESGSYVEDLAAQMLASTWGLEFDVDKAYDEQKDIFSIAGRDVLTRSVCQTAIADKDRSWVSVLAAAVFIV